MPCPYLGTKEDRSLMYSEPNPSNACYAQFTEEKKLFRTFSLDHADIPKKTQEEWCLSSDDKFQYCPHYVAQAKKPAIGEGLEDLKPKPIVDDEPEDDDGQSVKKAAILAAAFVAAALLMGALYVVVRGKPPKEPPPGSRPPITAQATVKPMPISIPATMPPLVALRVAPTLPPSPIPAVASATLPSPSPKPAMARPASPPPTLPASAVSPAEKTTLWSEGNKLLEIQVEDRGGAERLVRVTMKEEATIPKDMFLPADPTQGKPDRVFVDLKDVWVPKRVGMVIHGKRSEIPGPLNAAVSDDLIAAIRFSQNSPLPNLLARLVIDLKRPVSYQITSEPSGFVVTLRPK